MEKCFIHAQIARFCARETPYFFDKVMTSRASRKNEQISAHKKSACHSERREARVPTKVEVLLRECAVGDDPIQNRGANATKGYGSKSRWLTNGMLHFCRKPPKLQAISLRCYAPWFCLFASLNPQNFDFGLRPALRMTYRNIA